MEGQPDVVEVMYLVFKLQKEMRNRDNVGIDCHTLL